MSDDLVGIDLKLNLKFKFEEFSQFFRLLIMIFITDLSFFMEICFFFSKKIE